MIAVINQGVDRYDRLGKGRDFELSDELRSEQRRAVEAVLDSRDLAINVRGAAGTGKTVTLREIDRGLREAGREVVAVAPTRSAVDELEKVGLRDAMPAGLDPAETSSLMLRILEAMGVLALLTRETPAAIAAERKQLRSILESSASQARAVEKRVEAYTLRLESRLAQLPKELETGLDPPRIAKLLGESMRQSFQRLGLPATCSALSQSCTELNSIQKQLLNVLREVAHPDIGVIARTKSANDSLLRSMATRAQQMDDFIVRLEEQIWATWLPVVASAALALGFVLGTWFAKAGKRHAKLQAQHSRSKRQWSWLLASTRNNIECSIE